MVSSYSDQGYELGIRINDFTKAWLIIARCLHA